MTTMKRTPEANRGARSSRQASEDPSSDLRFVPATVDDDEGGGWYRELPGAQIEVMSRAQLERVPLEDADPEEKARTVVTEIIKRTHTHPRALVIRPPERQ